MGFKWFRARISMNRMPTESTVVVGSYRSAVFDSPINEFATSNRTIANGNNSIKDEPKLSSRAVSMPALNNPMVGIASADDRLELAPSNKAGQKQPKLSTKTRSGSELNVYDGSVYGNPVQANTLLRGINDNIAVTTPRPVTKMSKAEFKKKKAKAPAPKMKLGTGTSGNGSGEFITLKEQKKTSQSSDIDV